jgi:hypothetical protein
MLQQERINDHQEALRLAFDGLSRSIWSAMIGIVRDVTNYAARGTVTVELAIQAVVSDAEGNKTAQTLKPLVDVPVVFLGGGGMVATFPITTGDEALIIFADRCIDYWFAKGGVQRPAEPRAHDLSDAIALVGPRSLAKVIPNLSTTTAQFRSLDGSTYFEVASGGKANVVAPNGVSITGPVTIDGNVSVTGSISSTAEGTFNGISVSQHLHGGVQSGGSNTGTPIA